jgi:hypothetical protein
MFYGHIDLQYFGLFFLSTLTWTLKFHTFLSQINQDVESNAGMPPQTIHYNLTGVPCQKFNLDATRRASPSGDSASLERDGLLFVHLQDLGHGSEVICGGPQRMAPEVHPATTTGPTQAEAEGLISSPPGTLPSDFRPMQWLACHDGVTPHWWVMQVH